MALSCFQAKPLLFQELIFFFKKAALSQSRYLGKMPKNIFTAFLLTRMINMLLECLADYLFI